MITVSWLEPPALKPDNVVWHASNATTSAVHLGLDVAQEQAAYKTASTIYQLKQDLFDDYLHSQLRSLVIRM